MTIRVAVADDQPLVREGLTTIVARGPDMELVGEAGNGREAVAIAKSEQPDVFLMDVRMPLLDGIEATRMIRSDPATVTVRVLILTTFDLDEYVFTALQAGASGFLLKDVGPEALLDAIEVVANGEALLAPSVTLRLISEFAKRPVNRTVDEAALKFLTDREREVLGLVGRGMSNQEIADQLFVSPATVKTHVGRTLMKLNARDRSQLVVVAYESGLVAPGA
ncbi:MAG: response regulator transcription factor [Acidimicrobiia bacterium]|nr:response regulator transcription factor [Acidimicrobiia bacterium]